MSNTDFSDILNRPSSDAEPPKPLPVGTYLWLIQGMPTYDKSSKKQTPYVRFKLSCLQPTEDVDSDDLAEAGGCSGKMMNFDIYLNHDWSEVQLKEFANACGIDTHDGQRKLTHQERIESTAGAQVFGHIRHEAREDGRGVRASIDSIAAA